jgi:uncharacterized protein (TIGR02231 family)
MWKRVFVSLSACGLVALLALAARSVPADPDPNKAPSPAPAPGAKAATATAPAAVKAAASRVTAVTVYPNGALVTREVEVPPGPGTLELTVAPLPPATVNSSLYTEGTDGIRVLATRFRTRPVLEDTREDVRKLQDELEQLQDAQERLEADIKAAQANLQMVNKLENFTSVTTVHATEKGVLNSDSAIALSKHVMDCRAEKSKELTALQQQVRANLKKAEFARRKLGELAANTSRTERDAVLVVEKGNAAGKVHLHYLVDDASWRPQYKLRAGKSAKDPVLLEYLAAVVQHTGEDWSNVELVLSTAQPTLNAAPPDLQVLEVTVVPNSAAARAPARPGDHDLQEQVRNLRTKAQKDLNQKKQSTGVGLANTAAALDQSWELLNPEAAVRRGCSLAVREGPSVAYHLNARLTVPSRQDEQVLEVTRINLPPDYYYKAVPVLTAHVYRLADLTNRSDYVLLPGEATMYLGTDFVGQMNLPLVAIGEQFTAGFGIDPQLQVQRQMTDRSRSTQGGNQVLRYEYRILVSSYKPERVRVQVWDRLPHAENDTVGVSLLKAVPEPCKDALYVREQRPNNLLRWDVNVEAGMSGEKALAIQYEFKLELDRQMSIGSFQTSGVAQAEAQPAAPSLPPMTPEDAAKVRAAMSKLSPEDRRLAEAQVFCAIDQDSPLGLTGTPIKMMVKDQPVFVCCKGCQAEVRAHPDQALALLAKLRARLKAK